MRADDILRILSEEQHGVFTTRQAADAGVSAKQLVVRRSDHLGIVHEPRSPIAPHKTELSAGLRPTESGLEFRFHELAQRACIHGFERQVDLGDGDDWIGRADFGHRGLRLQRRG